MGKRKMTKPEISAHVEQNIDVGLWTTYCGDYIASVWYDLAPEPIHHLDNIELGEYVIQYARDGFPPHSAMRFHSFRELIVAMKEIQPNMRRWKRYED